MNFQLLDVAEGHEDVINVEVSSEMDDLALLIAPVGYGDYSSMEGLGCPILLERYGGRLRLVVWGDINQEEPTHIIDLEGARESCRKPGSEGDELRVVNIS